MRILYSGDSPTVNTGFGVVGKNIVNRLYERGHTVAALGVNHYGDPYDPKEFPYPIYPCDKGNADNVFGAHKLWAIAKDFQPDVLFFLNDPWVLERYMVNKSVDSPYLKTIAYYPIDGGPIKKKWIDVLNGFDAQVCYSEFALDVVKQSNGGSLPKNIYQIYHGVNRNIFRPINQSIARKQLGIPQDAFIVGMVARNQYRKRFDILVSAFAKFAQDKPNAKLYLHTVLQDIGYDITDLAEQFNLGDKLILTEDMSPAHGVSDAQLNLIYNTFDINVLVSLGDGFGLPVAESMATGCAQLVSDHSCLKELVDDHGGLTVKTSAWMMNTAGINTWGGVPDEDDLVEKLNLLYNSRELRIKLAEDGYKFISQTKFDWEHIVDSFEEIIKDRMHILPRKERD